MVQSILVKILLIPFALMYGFLISISNWMYKIGWLKSVSFSIPVISVGNLSVGGAGKSRRIEQGISSENERIFKSYFADDR